MTKEELLIKITALERDVARLNDKVNVLQNNVDVQEYFIKELCQRVADKDDKNKHEISESDAADILSEWMYGEAVKRPEKTHE
jgi:hypothetical protein